MSDKSDKRSRQSIIARVFAYEVYKMPRVCEECSTTIRIEVHHIDGDRDNNARENLKTLCKRHHNNLHKIFPPMKEKSSEIEILEMLPKIDRRSKPLSKTYLLRLKRWQETKKYRDKWGVIGNN